MLLRELPWRKQVLLRLHQCPFLPLSSVDALSSLVTRISYLLSRIFYLLPPIPYLLPSISYLVSRISSLISLHRCSVNYILVTYLIHLISLRTSRTNDAPILCNLKLCSQLSLLSATCLILFECSLNNLPLLGLTTCLSICVCVCIRVIVSA
jgi:hypothetical protein